MPESLSFPLSARVTRLLSTIRDLLRPLLYAGVPATLERSHQRELVTGNFVVLLSILVTIPDIFTFRSFHTAAGDYAALYAAIATAIYCICYGLLALGRRWLGICVFTNTVIWVLAVNVTWVGTDLGNQYYFVIVGVGVAFVWPSVYAYMRWIHAALGLLMFIVTMIVAQPYPWLGPPLSEAVTSTQSLVHATFAYVIAIGFVLYSFKLTRRAEAALEAERAKSEMLLLNVLPEPIAARLKEQRGIIADNFNSVTVLFADVVDFTPMSAPLRPEEVVAFLNNVFSRFDQLIEKHGLEKIKTIGDAYMVAGGIPLPRPDHAVVVAEVALEIAEVARRIRTPSGHPLALRIGIHTGPAVAGVIGTKKFSYDLWGDTVNTASRMETHGIPGTIQVTEQARAALQDAFEFESRGIIDVKGKGPMPVYLLRGRKTGSAEAVNAPAEKKEGDLSAAPSC